MKVYKYPPTLMMTDPLCLCEWYIHTHTWFLLLKTNACRSWVGGLNLRVAPTLTVARKAGKLPGTCLVRICFFGPVKNINGVKEYAIWWRWHLRRFLMARDTSTRSFEKSSQRSAIMASSHDCLRLFVIGLTIATAFGAGCPYKVPRNIPPELESFKANYSNVIDNNKLVFAVIGGEFRLARWVMARWAWDPLRQAYFWCPASLDWWYCCRLGTSWWRRRL